MNKGKWIAPIDYSPKEKKREIINKAELIVDRIKEHLRKIESRNTSSVKPRAPLWVDIYH